MKKTVFFIVLVSIVQAQSLFVDGVAAVVENKIVLKSDLNQMVNLLSIQQKIDPNKNPDKYSDLRQAVLGSIKDTDELKAANETRIKNRAEAKKLKGIP